MAKPGVALTDVTGLPPEVVAVLREQLSVTTADEFVDLADRMGSQLAALLDVDDATLDRWRARAAGYVTSDTSVHDTRRFPTGMEPPPEGRDTFGR